MLRNRLDVILQITTNDIFKCGYDFRVKKDLALMNERPIGNFVSQGMFESVFQFRKQIALVEKLAQLVDAQGNV